MICKTQRPKASALGRLSGKVVSITGKDGENFRFKILNDDSLTQLKLSESLEAGQAVTLTFQCEEV